MHQELSKSNFEDNPPHLQRHLALVQLLKSWSEEDEREDEQEQRDTWEQLKQALDQDRLSNRKLFP